MGSITPREKKPRNKCRKWRLFVSCGTDEYGRRIQRSRTVAGTYTEAAEELARFEIECKGITARDATFAEFAEDYIERRRPLLKESTYTNRKSVIATLIKIFGRDVKMSQMNSQHIETKMNRLMVEGMRDNTGRKACKPSYVASLYTYLSQIMKDAATRGVISKNPVEDIKRPNGKPEERKAPTIAMMNALVDEMDIHDKHEMCVVLIVLLGIRRGEALALRWQDIDFENNIVHIRHSLARNCVLTSPKTESSRRNLPMPQKLKGLLLERKAIVERGIRRSVRGGLLDVEPDLGDVFVVCDEMGRPTGPSSQTCWWGTHRDRFGLPGYTEHDLRHGYLTALAVAGVHPTVAQALAGHSTSKITMEVYSHIDMSGKVDGVATLEKAMEEVGSSD